MEVSTAGYLYTIENLQGGDENLQGGEIVAYHWHPSGGSPINTPHLHIEPASGAVEPVSSAHFPTGRMAIEDVVRLLIRDFGIQPLRPDWEKVLEEAQTAFDRWRTW